MIGWRFARKAGRDQVTIPVAYLALERLAVRRKAIGHGELSGAGTG